MPFDPDALPVPDLGLSCANCGYPLAHLTEHRCPECGRGFSMNDMVPTGDFPPMLCDGRPVSLTNGIVEILRRYQVPYLPLPTPMETTLGLTDTREQHRPFGVPREAYLEALDLIRRHLHGAGLPAPPPDRSAAPEWKCPGCNESNPGNFEVCWSCGAEQPQ